MVGRFGGIVDSEPNIIKLLGHYIDAQLGQITVNMFLKNKNKFHNIMPRKYLAKQKCTTMGMGKPDRD